MPDRPPGKKTEMKDTAQTDELDTGDSAIKEELKQAALKGGALVFV